MKKLLALLLAAAMLCSVAACGKKEAAEEPDLMEVSGSPSDMFIADVHNKIVLGEDKDPLKLAEAVIESDWVPFAGGAMEVEPGFLNGFTEEIGGFEKGAMFAPMIGSIPFVGYIFKTADEDASEKLVEQLEDSYDLRWNICTQADEMAWQNMGDLVIFVMGPESFEE